MNELMANIKRSLSLTNLKLVQKESDILIFESTDKNIDLTKQSILGYPVVLQENNNVLRIFLLNTSESLSLTKMAKNANVIAKEKGFWADMYAVLEVVPEELKDSVKQAYISQKIALIQSEASETLESLRYGLENQGTGKDSFIDELADIVIRVGDLSVEAGYDLEKQIKWKMFYNFTRSYKHGKQF